MTNHKFFLLECTFKSGYRCRVKFGPNEFLAAVGQVLLWECEGMCTRAEADEACNQINATIGAWEQAQENVRAT